MEKGLVSALMSSGNKKFRIPLFPLLWQLFYVTLSSLISPFIITAVLCIKCENTMGREDRVKNRGSCIKEGWGERVKTKYYCLLSWEEYLLLWGLELQWIAQERCSFLGIFFFCYGWFSGKMEYLEQYKLVKPLAGSSTCLLGCPSGMLGKGGILWKQIVRMQHDPQLSRKHNEFSLLDKKSCERGEIL